MYEKMALYKQFLILKNAFEASELPTYNTRKKQLLGLMQCLKKHTSELYASVNSDFTHRSDHETKLLEITPVIEAIKYTLKNLKRWMKPQKRRAILWFKSGRAVIMPQPRGVIGIMSSWNCPIEQSLSPLIAALAAGNRVMLKMSELTPATGALLKQLLDELFSEEEVQVIEGDANLSECFAELPFDYLLFGGSVNGGRKVMAAASQNLTPVTLTLGGKSPVIVMPDYPLKKAVENILMGKLLNAGQMRFAPDYVLIPKGQEESFVQYAKEYVSKHYPDKLHSVDYSSIVNPTYFARLIKLSQDAEEKGATIVNLFDEEHLESYSKFSPCLLLDLTEKMQIMREEIFGPMLIVLTYVDPSDAIRYINKRSKPLALYIFDHNESRVKTILSHTSSGGVTVNGTIAHAVQEDLPFGGIGASGMGQMRGRAGFDSFTHYRSVFYR